ncbi:MAG: ATP-binding protein [Verrucomicrobia bacterium]|nr:MAG: ATP-binding protein [Verrucomicrobiota bacterium]
MNNELGANKQLELLDRLKGAVESSAVRAERLEAEFRAKIAREKRVCEAAVEEQERQLTTALAEAEGDYQDALAREKKRFEARRTAIGRAYQSAKAKRLQAVEDRLGARKYELQKRMLQAGRDRESGLAGTTAHFEQLRQDLAVEQGRLAGLEQKAQIAFAGHAKLKRQFHAAYEKSEDEVPKDEDQALSELRELLARAETELGYFRKFFVVRLFKYWVAWVVVIFGVEITLVLQRLGLNPRAYQWAGGLVAGSLALLFVFRYLGQLGGAPLAASISRSLARARRLHEAGFENSAVHHQQGLEGVKAENANAVQTVDLELKQAVAQASDARVRCRMECDEQTVALNTRNEQIHRGRVEQLDKRHADRVQQLKQTTGARTQALKAASEEKQSKVLEEFEQEWRALEAGWRGSVEPMYASIGSAQEAVKMLFPPWDTLTALALPHGRGSDRGWTPPREFAQVAKFGELNVELEKLCSAFPKDGRLKLPGSSHFALPLCLAYPDQGSILIETANIGHDEAISALNDVILRLLSVSPPGRLNFTILDPVGLGQNFAGVMHLADYEEQMINSRIWTQSGQIEQKLGELNEHMEKVIQMYLRNEYQTIAEYNEQAGVIAEKYYFLVVADFPANFTEVAAKRLLSIAASGARCGVYTLIHWDLRQPLPQDFMAEELRKSAINLAFQGQSFALSGRNSKGAELVLDAPPAPEKAIEFIQQVGKASRDSSRVEVPFTQVAPPDGQFWTEETISELRVPIGRTGATKLQYLAIGKGTRQHGLVAGKTGSGKSTLFHVIITNLALWCSPEQVEFYLVDFKKGVEFKCYGANRLPHARVVAIESDREFGLSVLQRLDEELKRRGDLFRELGVQDLAGYKRAGGKESVPRSLLIIDEFQEFFVEDDKVAQTASLLLDRIVRQGRAFGIHVLLGSQTLGGAYTVARTTLGQMVIRIALQCNEADAYLIMDDTNPAPRLLSRPGEGIYNDMAGALEGNSPFQVVWLPDEERDGWLGRVRQKADSEEARMAKSEIRGEGSGFRVQGRYPGPIVFEGNAPADVRENLPLQRLLRAETIERAIAPRIWLGAPNSIKGPTEAVFQRQSGNNLLVVGQRDEATLTILSVGLISLAAQHPPGNIRMILCDATPPGTPHREYIEQVLKAVPHGVTLVRQADLPQIMSELDSEMKKRVEAADPDAALPVFLIIHGLQRYGKLRFEEDFSFSSSETQGAPNPATVLNNLLTEGTRLGFHVITTCDTYNNLSRFLSRKALSEFEMRVLFQMSANDSASLIDNPKAGSLGLHRALFHNAQEGYLETFRPYALPGREWIEEAGKELKRLTSKQGEVA